MGLYDEMQNRRNGVTSGIGSFNSKYGLSSPAGQTALRQATEAGAPRGLSYGAFDSRGNQLKVPKTNDYMRARSTPGGEAAPMNSIGLARAVTPAAPQRVVPQDNPAETEIDYGTRPEAQVAQDTQKKNRLIKGILEDIYARNIPRDQVRQEYADQGMGNIFDELITDDLDISQYGYGSYLLGAN